MNTLRHALIAKRRNISLTKDREIKIPTDFEAKFLLNINGFYNEHPKASGKRCRNNHSMSLK
jgi:hypothetical protein